ncbi:GntR family transcriptional regulator [Roseateles aquatilis]|uniref:GntR family transcriptional regulator n=1 Tax=Roseateles aquatilis TaxID=431061 RepID=A0A246JLS9_9BURK|nr:FadR/GntR family transcriptional regulator [Roseateles aquatilis]OWQ93500.1 GntR family transcriptional regulator [Roseateles aquatilis]
MSPFQTRSRPKTLALGLVQALGARIRAGGLAVGDKLPTEAAIMAEFEVSRTVVREAISKLQAEGLVETRHGIGTFVLGIGDGGPFRISADQMATLNDVIAVLELRIGIETEAAALASQRRSDAQLAAMREAVAAFAAAAEAGRDAVAADFQFHLEIARATGNPHFEQLMGTLGAPSIPRARLASLQAAGDEDPRAQRDYLLRVNAEHESILDAIAARDAEAARAAMRTHLGNSRERRRRAAMALQGREGR